MRRTAPVLLTAALALSALAIEGEDLTEHPCYDETTQELAYPEQQVWFHESDAKLGNVAAPAPWDTTPPAASVQDGAGAGTVTPGVATLGAGTPAEQHAVFAGTFEGCIDTVLFDVWSFDPTNRTGTSGSAQPANHNFGLTVTVDGAEVFSGGPLEAATTFDNEGMGPNLNRFALDLGETLELFAGFGALQLDGTHEIQIEIRSWFVNTGHSVYVWDTTEVPSGLTFNGEVTEEYASVG